jgi:hydroxypyruvate isomerase
MIRPCVVVPCFFGKTDLCEALKKIGALGFDCAEIYGWKQLDLDVVKRTVAETGVELLSMCTSEFRMTDPTFRTAWLEGLRESCEAANRVGARCLITQVGPDTGAERTLQHEAIVATLKAAKPILDTYGVTVMIEPLNHKNHPGYYLTHSKEAFDIVREVNHPFVKVVYDIYHQQVTEGNIIPSITEHLDCIAHLHGAGHPGRIELQHGENDYKVILRAAEEAGYRGAFGLEYRPTMPIEESLRSFLTLYSEN